MNIFDERVNVRVHQRSFCYDVVTRDQSLWLMQQQVNSCRNLI
jgi:hypothetical protein